MSLRRRVCDTAAVVLVLLTAGCGAGAAVPAGPPPTPFAGPLSVSPEKGTKLWEDPGAAGKVVDCDFPVIGGTSTTPYTGGEVGEDPEEALRQAEGEGIWDGLPRSAMTLVRSEPDRRLYGYAADGRTRQAVILRHGPAAKGTGAGRDGLAWWVESWARCDIAEFPAKVAQDRGYEIWTDRRGIRRPINEVVSYPGGDCVKGTRFVEIGRGTDSSGDNPVYVAGGNAFPDHFAERYRTDVRLPADAVDSGFSHGDEHLWFSADRTRAYVGDAQRVDLWPRTVQPLACA